MAKANNVMEQSAAELQLKAAMAKVAELRDLVNVGKTEGMSHAEKKLQEVFLALWKSNDLILRKEEAKRLYDATAVKLRGKNVVHAKNHLATLFSDNQGDSFFDEVKPRKNKSASTEGSEKFVDALDTSLAEISDSRSLDEVLGNTAAGVA